MLHSKYEKGYEAILQTIFTLSFYCAKHYFQGESNLRQVQIFPIMDIFVKSSQSQSSTDCKGRSKSC